MRVVLILALMCIPLSAQSAGDVPKDVYPDSRSRLPVITLENLSEHGKKAYDTAAANAPNGVLGEGVDQLLGGPRGGGVFGDVDVHDATLVESSRNLWMMGQHARVRRPHASGDRTGSRDPASRLSIVRSGVSRVDAWSSRRLGDVRSVDL